MKNVRIYKDDIRIHMLRSLFFTDSVIVFVGTGIIAALLYVVFHYVLHFFSWGYFISALIVSVIFFITFITQRVDNQPFYKILPRALKFKTSTKEQRYSQLEPYFTDFSIKDNYIIRDNSVVTMYRIEPYDVALLNEQDREHFFVKLKQVVHLLPTEAQFIVRKEQAQESDYSSHFFSLYDSSSRSREKLIHKYIEELTSLIRSNSFTTTRHYVAFSVQCAPEKPQGLLNGLHKLNDMGMRFATSVAMCNIDIRALYGYELERFVKDTLR